MSEEEESSKEVGDDECGLFLGCWDNEKTLIQDLEHAVSSVEKKCKKLFEDLIYYKKYLEKSEGPDFYLNASKKKPGKQQKSHLICGSEPNIAFRKNLVDSQELQQVFEEKFQAKLHLINKELREAANKMGLQDKIILLGTSDFSKPSNARIEDKIAKDWADESEKYLQPRLLSAKAKSDPVILENGKDEEFSRITKNELELYQKLSRLSLNGKMAKSKSRGRKLKFFSKRKTFSRRPDSSAAKKEPKKAKCTGKLEKRKKRMTLLRRSRSSRNLSPTDHFQDNLVEPEEEKLNKLFSEDYDRQKWLRSDGELRLEGNQTLGAAIKKMVPFTACASTSKSFNLGLNMQQLLSLSKHRKIANAKSSASEKTQGGGKTQNYKLASVTSFKEDIERRHASWFPSDAKNGAIENDEVNRTKSKGKVSLSEQSKSSNYRKFRSKYTGNSSEGLLEYHKSSMSQYTNGRKSMFKSEFKTAYAVGSKIMVSDCKRTVLEIDRNNNGFENASGDGISDKRYLKGNAEWSEVYGSFLRMYRKYSALKGKLTGNDWTHADGELQSLENEIDCSIEKYKDFLQFYSKFLHLNHRLKLLKNTCESKMFGPVTHSSSNVDRKFCIPQPTYSTITKKALREVQALQDKIRLVNV